MYRQQSILGLISIALLVVLVACSGRGPVQTGSISGTVSPGVTKPSSLDPVVPGEVIVKFRSALTAQSASSLKVQGVDLQAVRALGLARTQLYSAGNLSQARTLELVEALRARPDVEWAQPNGIKRVRAVPNDPLYAQQWHYRAMNLEAAWDISKGTPGTVVAVIDTGILWDENDPSRQHPDFVGKILPGYDFVRRAPNPFDPFPNASGYHGTHVAGTIAAATNNGIGVAGVNWNAKLVNVRVLGPTGADADIIDGTLWAAGISVPNVPNNANPASVLNLSLGGSGPCSPAYQDAFNQVNAKGAIAIVAAGNSNVDAANENPNNCQGVISVGATRLDGQRAAYSNWGTVGLDVMAPGGDPALSFDVGGQTFPAEVFSTWRNDTTGQFDYAGISGTSMAAPHVAGLVSIMKGLKPSLTVSEAKTILQNTARKLSDAECQGQSTTPRPLVANDCGAGSVDAAKALAALQSAPAPSAPPTPPPSTQVKTFVLARNKANNTVVKQVQLTLTNADVPFTLPDLPLGTYQVIAVRDLKGDGNISLDDPTSVTVEATIDANTPNPSGLKLVLQPAQAASLSKR